MIVFADDGEKLGRGAKPTTVYDDGWLKNFSSNCRRTKIGCTSSRSVRRSIRPRRSARSICRCQLPRNDGMVVACRSATCLPIDGSPNARRSALARDSTVCNGGIWRNFKVKYEEANEMYAQMMHVSDLLKQAEQEGLDRQQVDPARQRLYRGQCNCHYWHGAFGGLYLPHLRHAVYHELIRAETLLEQAQRQKTTWVEATADDYNFDAKTEIRLASDQMVVWLAPSIGGRMYGLDVRAIGLNLLATMMRRPEAYHQQVQAGQDAQADSTASIHDRVVFKQPGLEHRLQYDRQTHTYVDHFWPEATSLAQVANNEAADWANLRELSTKARFAKIPNAFKSN